MQNLRLFAIIAAAFVLIPLVSANTYDLKEFTKDAPMQGIILEEGDQARFNLLGGKHTLWLKEIDRNEKGIKMRVFPFSNEASLAQGIPVFTIDNLVKIDLNKDDIDDILLDIDEIKDGRITLLIASASHIAESQAENIGSEITGTPQGQGVVTEQKNYSNTFWAIGIAIVVLAVILYVKAIGAKEKKAGKHKKEEKAEG